MRRSIVALGLVVAALNATAAAQSSADPALLPWPAALERTAGEFELRDGTAIVADRRSMDEARTLAAALAPATGFTFAVMPARRAASARGGPRLCAPARAAGRCRRWIRLRLRRHGGIAAEGYRLVVRPGAVVIQAGDAAGLFYGGQTLRQLLPPAILRDAPVAGASWRAPAVRVDDAPRFPWRGAHLDVARHFLPIAAVLRFLDAMALHKLNTFHWHLTDDQGWRFPVAQYPRLTAVGGFRAESPLRPLPDGAFLNFFLNPLEDGTVVHDDVPHGGAYSADDVREVVAYAAVRHITVVPEIDMPGHIQSAIAAYPELGNLGTPIPVATDYGISDHVLSVDDATLDFVRNVLLALMDLFPSERLHLGGDEVRVGEWQQSAAAQARMAALGFTDARQLQGWFVNEMVDFLAAHGRHTVGWDEMLRPELRAGVTLMTWHGDAKTIAAARAGHDVVATSLAATYLDYANALPLPPAEQTRLDASSLAPLAPVFTTTLAEVYAFEPVPAALSADDARHVLGAQGQLWSEWIENEDDLQVQAFPRLAALAEVAWTPAARRDYAAFSARLPTHLARLAAAHVRYFGDRPDR